MKGTRDVDVDVTCNITTPMAAGGRKKRELDYEEDVTEGQLKIPF